MSLPISLFKFANAMESASDEVHHYINRLTGEILMVTDEELRIIEYEDEEEALDYADWMKEHLEKVKEVMSSRDWIEMPDTWDIDDYDIMRDYCYTVDNQRILDELLNAISGRGAFRMFRNTAARYNLLDDWYAFKQEAYKRIAIDWLEEYGIPYSDDIPAGDAKAQQPGKKRKDARSVAKPNLSVAVLGIPNDENSSFLRGAAKAPPRIREAFHSSASNKSSENGIDLGERTDWQDYGDIDFSGGVDAFELIEHQIGKLLDAGLKVLSLGGDHAITYPIVRAFAKKYPDLNILHLDAHPDLYDELEGNRLSHACPFARIMEAGLASRLVQVGIRTMNPHQQAQSERFGTEVVHMRQFDPGKVFEFRGPLYISLDMDVLDPAFAPGISHYEPGGPTTRDVLRILQNVKGNIVGADIVEYNPDRDLNGMTAMTAAKFLKEMVVRMVGEK